MPVYSYIFGVAIAFLSYFVYEKYMNVYTSIVQIPNKRYDYIIVGAGTSGCVLASRLSEDPSVSVLLVEAGSHMSYFTKVPLAPTAAQLGPNDWSVRTTRQKYSSFGLWNQTQLLPRGKGLGGSGQINFLLHGFGLPEDYERWSRSGFHGWTQKDLEPYFVKAFGTTRSEFDSSHCANDKPCIGDKVPMKLKLHEDNELTDVFIKASQTNRDSYTLLRRPTATVSNGKRHSTYDGYLKHSLRRKNLHVLINTQAVSVRFVNTTAVSLYILQNHRRLDNIFANKEIILCAGAIKTPQLLIMSGIGPKSQLQRLKVKMVSDNEAVGENFHDHMNMPLYVSIKKPISVNLAKVFSFSTAWDYMWNGKGLLAFPPVAGVEYQNNTALMLFSMGSTSERLLREISNYKQQVFYDTFPFYNQMSLEGFMFLATCTQPKSRGKVVVAKSDIRVPPIVDPNYLHSNDDMECMIKAIRRAIKLLSSVSFQEIGATMHWPRPERCLPFWNYTKAQQLGIEIKKRDRVQNLSKPKHIKKRSRIKNAIPPKDYIACIIREVAVTGHHSAGTAAGGTVVDKKLRVRSVKNLRVVDASVFPTPVSLYPNSLLVAMAEKAADIIKSDHRKRF